MLSQTQVVKIKNAIESMYEDTFNLVEYQKVVGANHVTSFQEVTVQSNIPCRLSFSSANSASKQEANNSVAQTIELFTAKTVDIKEGSKIVVTHDGGTYYFKRSGIPSVYKTHQEVMLEDFKGWS